MRVGKQWWLNCALSGLAGIGVTVPAMAAAPQDLATCLTQGKKQFSSQEYDKAKTTFTQCVKIAPEDVDAQLSLAGVLLTLDELEAAAKTFEAALTHMNSTSPYLSYTYSMLGDIALKQQKNDEALAWYTKSLESNAANVNSLVGKGVIVEFQGDKKAAAEFYRSALAVEPLNVIARRRLINLEPDYMNDSEILAALKQRRAIKADETVLTDEMRQQFRDIHQAEQRRGVDYLKNKYPHLPADYVVTINKDTEFAREMLTRNGYEALQKNIGQDAIVVFQRIGVPVQDVFNLRDKTGKKIFKPDNTLTESGFWVYTEALQNRKQYLLPNESLPPTQEFLNQLGRIEESLKKQGYMEISPKELKFIEKQTKCSVETLRKDMGMYALPVTKTDRKYFILTTEQKEDPKKGVPYYYLMKEKAKYDSSVKVPKNSLVQSYEYYGYTVCFDDGKLAD